MPDLSRCRRLPLAILTLSLLLLLLPGCMTRPGDGLRVASEHDAVDMGGQVPAAGQSVDIEAYNPAVEAWEKVGQAISAETGATMMGLDWYPWDTKVTVPPAYWADAPSGYGKYARLRAAIADRAFITFRQRDVDACLSKHQGDADITGVVQDCAGPRRTEVYVYTEDYESGSPGCSPGPDVSKASYSVDELLPCKRRDLAELLTQCIDHRRVARHHDHMLVQHNGVCGPNSFFRGHRQYVREMEECLSVFGEKWLPDGRLPYWQPSSPMPVELRGIAPNRETCESTNAGCGGWRQVSHPHPDFTAVLPPSFETANICQMNADSLALFDNFKLWHSSVHTGIGSPGGTFAMFDSPSTFIFWPWHKFVDLKYDEWLSCGYTEC